ncbi:hypothetical protein [Phyllobacterium salinisoli]|nr:hypothetical protein [Phyllobacterium salinisoli]
MRRFIILIAVLGALVSGWLPALSATFDIGGGHTMSGTETAHSLHRGSHEHGSRQSDERKDAAVHPMLCAACFALPAESGPALRKVAPVSAYGAALAQPLAGTVPSPLSPPPRA